MKLGYVIAIDGPSGAGKSTVARRVAERMGYRYIDTGAMYRASALFADRENVDINDSAALEDLLDRLSITQAMQDGQVLTFLDGEDVSTEIRTQEMGMKASAISAVPMVRQKLLELQREMGEKGKVVMEGRDIGSVVFPDADFKFFLTASNEERARRRHQELVAKGDDVSFQKVLREIETRDHNDSTRAAAPLVRTDDAFEIDSTGKSIDKVVDEIVGVIDSGKGSKE